MLHAKLIVLGAAVLLAGCLGPNNRPLQLVSGSGPVYPAAARAQGIEGYVVVEYDVTEAGTVANSRVLEADPAGIFDAAALAAVSSWVFKPELIDGQPQERRRLQSTVSFKLGSGSEYSDY